LRIVAWNANAVSTKKAGLALFLNFNKINIAAISETKLLPKYRFTIPGYKIYRSDKNQFGRGVMLIINNNLRHEQFYLPNLVGLEATAICLYLQNHNQLLFASAYLPLTSAIVPTDLKDIFAQNDSVVLVGDLNSKRDMERQVSEQER
jgi:exonuclease III